MTRRTIKVFCLNNGEVYESIFIASITLNLSESLIGHVIHGRLMSAKGYVFFKLTESQYEIYLNGKQDRSEAIIETDFTIAETDSMQVKQIKKLKSQNEFLKQQVEVFKNKINSVDNTPKFKVRKKELDYKGMRYD